MAHRGRHSADDKLAAALAGGLTARDAAAAAGIGERTVTRRLGEASFRGRVAELRSAMVRAAAGKLADCMTAAAEVLRAQLQSTDENIRQKAAVKIIELGTKLSEVAELETQLADLAERVAAAEAIGGVAR